MHPSLHGSLVRHQDMNPKDNQGLWFKACKVSIEIKRIGAGMLVEQGGNSR